MSNVKAIQAAALAIQPKFIGFLKGDMPKAVADELARAAIEAAAPVIREEVEREVVEDIHRITKGRWGEGVQVLREYAECIQRGDHRK